MKKEPLGFHLIQTDEEIMLNNIKKYKEEGIIKVQDFYELYFYEDNTVILKHLKDDYNEVLKLDKYEDLCFITNLIEEF